MVINIILILIIIATFIGGFIMPFYNPSIAIFFLALPAGFGASIAYDFLMKDLKE
jgi:hypothetical protein